MQVVRQCLPTNICDETRQLTQLLRPHVQTIAGLEKDVDALRTELGARDDVIGEKEERIAQIKHRAQVRGQPKCSTAAGGLTLDPANNKQTLG